MSMLHSVAEAVRDLVDRLAEASRYATQLGQDEFYPLACRTGEADKLVKLIAYIRTLNLVGELLLKIDKSINIQLRKKVFKLDLKLIALAENLEGLFVNVSDLVDNTEPTLEAAMQVAEKHSAELSETAAAYIAIMETLKPVKEATPANPLVAAAAEAVALNQPIAVTAVGEVAPPTEPAANEEAAGEDFETAVETAGRAVAPIPQSPPAPPAPPVPPAPPAPPAPANP